MEVPEALSAKFKDSFAYKTVKDRMPVILTKAIDTIHKQTTVYHERYGEPGSTDVKRVIGELSKLRSEMMTDKPFTNIDDDLEDAASWNKALEHFRQVQDTPPSFFTSPWLFTECMMYRRIKSALQKSEFMKTYDPYKEQKEVALQNSMHGAAIMAEYINNFLGADKNGDALKTYFKTFLEASLWSNKFDLSLSAGVNLAVDSHNPVEAMKSLEEYLLVDDSDKIFSHLCAVRKSDADIIRVDIVLDNAGFEFTADLFLAEFLIESRLANEVHFHVKNMPWFVSDVTEPDFHYTMTKLASQDNSVLAKFGKLWQSRLREGHFVLAPRDLGEYWTLWTPYYEMKSQSPKLYHHLQNSNLIIFKGDLNFRKLVADLNWLPTTSFEKSLQGFSPAPLCSLRTLKADVVVSLKPGVAEEAAKRSEDWMVSGENAVILFHC